MRIPPHFVIALCFGGTDEWHYVVLNFQVWSFTRRSKLPSLRGVDFRPLVGAQQGRAGRLSASARSLYDLTQVLAQADMAPGSTGAALVALDTSTSAIQTSGEEVGTAGESGTKSVSDRRQKRWLLLATRHPY